MCAEPPKELPAGSLSELASDVRREKYQQKGQVNKSETASMAGQGDSKETDNSKENIENEVKVNEGESKKDYQESQGKDEGNFTESEEEACPSTKHSEQNIYVFSYCSYSQCDSHVIQISLIEH